MAVNKKDNGGLGVGIAAAVAAAALGGYLLYGKDGAKNRKKVKGWMLKAKGEILERVENLETASEEAYRKIVKQVLARYKGARNVTTAEMMELAADVERHWKTLKPLFKGPAKGRSAGKKGGSGKRKAARPSTKGNTRKKK